MKVVVVGGGRIGLPLACVFADNGAQTTVCDINPFLVENIRKGLCPYEEPGLPELLRKVHQAHLLTASTETSAAAIEADVIVVIVPAHLTHEREIDLRMLKSASADIGRGLRKGALIIYETTVCVQGTRLHLVPILEKNSGMKAGADFSVAFSPERVKANKVLLRLRDTPKVVGGYDEISRGRAVAFYSRYLGAPVDDVGTLEAAELAKLIGMIYRDVNIALANELAEFSERVGIDFNRVCEVSNRDGEASLLNPGIGVGGHCTPVYPYFLTQASLQMGLIQRLATTARAINDQQPRRHLLRLAREWGPLQRRRVHIMGLGFRPEVKVDTFSPAYAILNELRKQSAIATLEDPYYSIEEIRRAGFTPARVGEDFVEAVILNTAHADFANPDFWRWRATGVEAVVDGRNLWDAEAARRAGILFLGVGKAIGKPVRETARTVKPSPELAGA